MVCDLRISLYYVLKVHTAECCVGQCSGGIEAGFGLYFYVFYVCFERHAIVVCHSECGGRVGVGYGCDVESYCGL